MLWLETIWMGLISLEQGLLAGIGLSQLMSLAVSNLFQGGCIQIWICSFRPGSGEKYLVFSSDLPGGHGV